MPSSTSERKLYRRGYLAELRAVEELRGEGYLALRVAGSRGPFDIVALGEEVRFIQVKRAKPGKEKDALAEARREIAALPGGFRREVWVWVDRRGFVKEVV